MPVSYGSREVALVQAFCLVRTTFPGRMLTTRPKPHNSIGERLI
jgi:hypothetical protein